jgi:hypothetical protein
VIEIVMKSIFLKPKFPRLARAISIKSPSAFKQSISRVRRLKGFTKKQKQSALNLAKGRATAMLGRRNLSLKERREFRTISRIKFRL